MFSYMLQVITVCMTEANKSEKALRESTVKKKLLQCCCQHAVVMHSAYRVHVYGDVGGRLVV